ncbi:MAG: hypothetical protein ACRDL7_01575 [Gaiellaceae bacterium]
MFLSLVVVNLNVQKGYGMSDFYEVWSNVRDSQVRVHAATVKSVTAQLHCMESYINPNVGEVLGANRQLSASSGRSPIARSGSDDTPIDSKDSSRLGVALIEPVTASVEITQVEKSLFPLSRTINVSMEASAMLSFEDIGLIEAVICRWSTERERQAKQCQEVIDIHLDEDRSIGSDGSCSEKP